MTNKILVCGSLAYDRIFKVEGTVTDKIKFKDNQIEKIDMTFRADEPVIYYGGTGGNIAYGLAKLKSNVDLYGIAGRDFNVDYKGYLEELGVNVITAIKEDSYTATFYGVEDQNGHTISIWQPNASQYVDSFSIKDYIKKSEKYSYAIISPVGKPLGMIRYIRELREVYSDSIKIIFDPGQDLTYLPKEAVIEALELSDILILNDIEAQQIENISELGFTEIVKRYLDFAVMTCGKDGAYAYTKTEKIFEPALDVQNIVQAIGAGDAFRAGFLSSLVEDNDLQKALKSGTKNAAKSLTVHGGQGY